MTRTFKLNHTIAENVNARPKDVLSAKRYLYDMGYYEPPQWGITEFPDHALIDAIRNFQRAYGLRIDGVMKPGGESEETIQKIHTQARTLQGMGRNGDTVLAHITPAEARLLKARGGAGTTNPATGLLEFYNADKKQGSYIWRTTGDSKVRSSHAGRNGKTFSWDAPPQGGHPGEAYNCRCRAEDVKEKKKDCEKIREEVRAANQRINDLQKPILEAEYDKNGIERTLKDLKSERTATRNEIAVALIPSMPKFKPSISDIIDAKQRGDELLKLQIRLDEIETEITSYEKILTDKKKQLKKLERERETHRQASEELSRRYQACIEKNKELRK